ncbi:hypothetical protein HY989_03905 [Candidatus Micrarchaeota archaeon]|nr:hypothetical protein [Candidatus Micrarchaeota archaeon]
MKIFSVFLVLILAIAAGCISNNVNDKGKQIVCTEDAKICPNGTSVGRDPNNSCEFYACSNERPIPVEPDGGIGTTDPYTRYVSTSPEECKTMLFQCIEGSAPFSDGTGCGCRAIEPKKIIGKSADECSRIRYMCVKNYIPYSDENSCGCEFTFEEPEPVPSAIGKLKAFDCSPEQRKAEFCTEEYAPVCGWNDPANIQCIKYPCAQTYGNSCNACKDENVAYYTQGACPTS